MNTKRIQNHLQGLTAVLGLLVLAACGSHSDKPDYLAATPKDSSLQTFLFDTVRLEKPYSELVLNGKIGYDQDSVTPIFPFVSGVVENVEVGLGDYVKKGQVLAYVHSGDVAERESNFREAKTDLDLAERTYQNTKAQYDDGFASEADLVRAKNAYVRAQQELRRTEEVLKLYGSTAQDESKSLYTVRAPLDGYIVARNVNTGTQIRPDNGSPMFIISNLRRVWAFANIYEQDVRKVHIGLKASVEVLSFPGKDYLGQVDRVATSLDEQSRVLQARINLPNPNGELRPEMFATIHLQLEGDTTRRLSLPSRAVIFDNNKYYVVAGNGTGNFHPIQVDVIRSVGNRAFVAAGRLSPGDSVLTEGNLTVYADLTHE